MYIDRPLREYLDDLAAKKTTPGGGSAAALTAALGTSLVSMAANFTIGKSEYKNVESKVSLILAQVRKFDSELRALIEEDIEAYKKLSNAIREYDGADAKLGVFYKAAARPPFLVSEIAVKCMKLCRELSECGNKNLVTDIAMAAILFEAAFFSAKFNIYVNLKYIDDMEYIAKIHNSLVESEDTAPKLKEEILEICEDAIGRSS